MRMRYRILILIVLLAGGYYMYDAFMEYRSKPPVDTVQQQAADKIRGQLP